MTLRFLNYIMGYYKISVCPEDAEKAMNILLEYNFTYSTPIRNTASENRLEFNITARHVNDFKKACAPMCINFETSKVRGFPRILELYKKRLGVVIGIIYFLAMIWMSTLFIWDVTVTGNDEIKDNEVINLLNELGCGIGSFIPNINFDDLHNKYLLSSKNIAWIAVNMKGVVAEVEVREIKYGDNSEADEKTAANIVAKYDGQIYTVEVIGGRTVVKPGDVVKKGELLISGVVDVSGRSSVPGVRYEKASGKVLAAINKEIYIVIPLTQEKKVLTGNSSNSYLINIFGKDINLSINSRISESGYDKIVNNRKLTIFGEVTLPVNIITETYNEYEIQNVTISMEEAADLAFKKFRVEIDAALSGEDTQLLERRIETAFDSDNFYLKCSLHCIEDIAESVPFSVN